MNSLSKKFVYIIFLVLLLVLGIFTRFAGNNYDNGLHLHPDERWLIMVSEKLNLFDKMNPDFFAYGTLPLYILKATGQIHDYLSPIKLNNYDGLLYIGRSIVSVTDIMIMFMVILTAWLLTRKKSSALLAGLIYCLLFFPIQNSNFFTVDTFLNFNLALVFLGLIGYMRKKQGRWLVLVWAGMGLGLASKITALIIIGPVLVWLIFSPLLSGETYGFGKKILQSITLGVWSGLMVGLFYFVAMPYGVINFAQMYKEVTAQLQMNKDAYVFPYTLQYVGTTPYIYYLKNIFLWGAGPILSLLGLAGLVITIRQIFRHRPGNSWRAHLIHWFNHPWLIYLGLNLVYLLVIGRSAVKFMRYLLPLYPAIAILAAVGITSILTFAKIPWRIRQTIVLGLLTLAGWWTLSFLSIYSQTHSRIAASNWMITNIPAGSTIADEHWDDRMPIYGSEKFKFVDLPLYEIPDNETKWKLVNSYLDQADYIVLASNRLSTPLPKLADCSKWKKCYPLTTQYYQKLFAGQMGFEEVARFNSFPKFWTPWGYIALDDQAADESFTVYDHPQVILFKKSRIK